MFEVKDLDDLTSKYTPKPALEEAVELSKQGKFITYDIAKEIIDRHKVELAAKVKRELAFRYHGGSCSCKKQSSIKNILDSPKENNAFKTPVETVIGWLSVFFSFLVMSCGYKDGQINATFWAGAAMILIGIIFIVIGKQKQKKLRGSPSGK